MTKKEKAEEIINFFNELISIDPETKFALEKLFKYRVSCGEGLANHPTVQVGYDDNKYSVSLIGILNGFVGVKSNGWGYIATAYDDENNLIQLQLTKFDD